MSGPILVQFNVTDIRWTEDGDYLRGECRKRVDGAEWEYFQGPLMVAEHPPEYRPAIRVSAVERRREVDDHGGFREVAGTSRTFNIPRHVVDDLGAVRATEYAVHQVSSVLLGELVAQQYHAVYPDWLRGWKP